MDVKGGSLAGQGISGFLTARFSQAAQGINHFCAATRSRAVSLIQQFSTAASEKWRAVTAEARLLEEGLVHIGSADAQTQLAFRRDAVTCAVETGLSVAEGVELEATVAIAALETGEKIVNSAPGKVSLREAATDMATSIVSSAMAALSAGASALRDLEVSGMEWEARRGRAGKAPAPPEWR